jgi:hypothetical protein
MTEARIETDQEQIAAKIKEWPRRSEGHGFGGKSSQKKQWLQQSIMKSLMKRPHWRLLEHWRTDLGTSNQSWDTGGHGKGGLRMMVYRKLLKDGRLQRYDGHNQNATTT